MTDETLKGLYKFCEEKSKNIKLKAEPQVFVELCNALEELKDYRDKNKMVVRIDCANSDEFKDIAVKLAKEQYNKAIDDFASLCLKHKSKDDYPVMCFDEFTIKKFAEQLKEGAGNEV